MPEQIDYEAERQLLGSALVTNCVGALVTELHLRSAHFGTNSHKAIWKACAALEADGKIPDCILVAAKCPTVPADYISTLATEVVSPGNSLHHGKLVIEAARWRKRERAIKELGKATDARDLTAFAAAESKLDVNGDESTALWDSERLGELVYSLAEGNAQSKSFSWGFNALDRARRIHPANVVIVSAHSGIGKSLFIDQILDANENDASVALYLTEMSVEERVSRRVTRRTGIPPSALEQGNLDEGQRNKVLEVLNKGIGWPIVNAAGWQASEVCADIRRSRRDLVAVDILNQLPYKDESELAAMMGLFANTAKQSGTAIIIACDLNEARTSMNASGRRPSPRLGDLKGSGSLSRRADTVAFVHRGEDDSGFVQQEGRVWLAKQRSGRQISLPISFDPQYLRLND